MNWLEYICEEIVKINKNFYWNKNIADEGYSAIPMTAWDKIYLPERK